MRLNDSDTQAKRILLWQQALVEMPPDERQRIELDPLGSDAQACAVTVELRLEAWQKKRANESPGS